jgi:hypothetical protein
MRWKPGSPPPIHLLNATLHQILPSILNVSSALTLLLKHDMQQIPALFWFNALLIASALISALAGFSVGGRLDDPRHGP